MFIAPNVASIMNATPAPRRGIASGMSSTLVNTGFLLSLGLAFAVMAASVPTTVLQTIFSGSAGGVSPVIEGRFIGSIHGLFLIMGFIALFAAVPAYMTKRRRPDYGVAAAVPLE